MEARRIGLGGTMSLHEADHSGRALDETEQRFGEPDKAENLMTPARRMALAALEREFHDLLAARS